MITTRIYTFGIILFAAISCTNNKTRKKSISNTNTLSIKKIGFEGFVQNSHFSIKRDTLFILENFFIPDDERSGKCCEFHLTYLTKKDSAIDETAIMKVEITDTFRVINRMKKNPFFINHFSDYKFQYDTIPVVVRNNISANEVIIGFKRVNSSNYYLTHDNSMWKYKLHIMDSAFKNKFSFNIDVDGDDINFLLFDIIDDNLPEIFVFKKSMIRDNLIELLIYKIE